MTSKLKCPYCSADLESTTGGWEYGCTNTECQSAGTLCGTNELWQALIQVKQDLEQSEKCCSAWETQALDYKAETIALSGKLEIARKALKDIKSDYELYSEQGCRMEPNETDMYNYACNALEQITHDNSEKTNSQEHKEI